MIRLPGGPVDVDTGRGVVVLAPPNGQLERLMGSRDEPGTVPARVTAVLATAVTAYEGHSVDTEWCRALSSGDRRFLLRRVLVALGRGTEWRTVVCPTCGDRFDVVIDHDLLVPVPVDDAWPAATVTTAAGDVRVRPPTGADEEAVAHLTSDDAAAALLARCATGIPDIDALDAETCAALDDAIEALGPNPVLTVAASCAVCGAAATVDVDPYDMIGRGEGLLLRDVHEIARAYHWAEHDILDLPTVRRRAYLALIDTSSEVLQ